MRRSAFHLATDSVLVRGTSDPKLKVRTLKAARVTWLQPRGVAARYALVSFQDIILAIWVFSCCSSLGGTFVCLPSS